MCAGLDRLRLCSIGAAVCDAVRAAIAKLLSLEFVVGVAGVLWPVPQSTLCFLGLVLSAVLLMRPIHQH